MSAPLRRILAAFASLVFALVGLSLVAAPVQAVPAAPTAGLKGYGVCDVSTGEWVITWKLKNNEASAATLSELAVTVTPSPLSQLSNIENLAVVAPYSTLYGVQRLAGSTNSATLSVKAKWSPSGEATVSYTWERKGVVCSTDTTKCTAIAAGVFQHTFTASNGSPTTTATIWRKTYDNKPVMSLCAPQKLTLVSYFALSASFALPQYVFDFDAKNFTPTTYELNFQVAMPPCFTQSDFVTDEKIDPLVSTLYGNRKIGSGGAPGNISSGPAAWFNGNGTAGGVCAHPAATVTPKCDGSGTVQLSNGLDNNFANVNFTWTLAGVSDASYAKSVAPNTSHSFTVISSQFPVVVTGSNNFTTTLNWAWPAECEQPEVKVEPDCKNLILTVTNAKSKTVNATATYNGSSQTKPVTQGNTTTFTFPAGTGSATITIEGAPYWKPLTATFTDSDRCHLADTGISATTVTAIGASLAAAGALLIYVVARTMGRRRRVA